MAQPLEGRNALVTGSSKGVGKGIALALARAGANVAINYHSDVAGAEATAEEIRELGREAFAVQANVGDSADVAKLFDATLGRLGKLNILVNNAGVRLGKPCSTSPRQSGTVSSTRT
jgi:NAD(P)-dependent dehydrogenase (short-subunit alcohol dehydrogenase family)